MIKENGGVLKKKVINLWCQYNKLSKDYLRVIFIWCCGLLLANWFIVGAGPDCFVLLPIMLSRSIFNPEPAQVEPTCVGVLLDVWFLFVDVGGRRFVTGDNPIVPKYDFDFSPQSTLQLLYVILLKRVQYTLYT